jgi:hypothetical protein
MNHTGEDYATIAAWESATEGALGGDIERLEIWGDDDSGIVTVSSTITFSGATGVSATSYREIVAKSGDGWEGDMNATNPVTIACQGNYRLVMEEEYFRFDGIRFTGNGASNFTFGTDADNFMAVRCFFDGRDQAFNIFEITGSRAGVQMLRCVVIDCNDYTWDSSSSGTCYCQNCTFSGCAYGPSSWGSGRTVYNNSISVGNSNNHYADAESNWATGTDYNIQGDSNYSPTGNLITNATATASTSPGGGTWVMYDNITSGSEDFNIQDHASNSAKDYGKTLTGEVVTDAAGVAASGTWECGALNFAAAPSGETYNITISSSVDLSHAAEPQRWRDRVTGDTLALNDAFIAEIISSYVINSIMISSDLTLNDGSGVQRQRYRLPSSTVDLGSSSEVQRWRDRLSSSIMDLGSSTLVQRERSQLLNDVVALGTAIGRQLNRSRRLETPLDALDAVGVQRQRDLLLSSIFDLDTRMRVARELDRVIATTVALYDAVVRSIQYGEYQISDKVLSSSLELNDLLKPTVWYVRRLLSSLVVTHSLTYAKARFLLNAILLHSDLEVNDTVKVERRVLRLCESFVPFYESLSGEVDRQRLLADELVLYDDILQDAIKVLSDILLHDNLDLSHQVIASIQRLFKPIGVIIYGLEKPRIAYTIQHGPGKIVYELKHREGIVYRLLNIKGETIYHD